jgi:hypothetical protein
LREKLLALELPKANFQRPTANCHCQLSEAPKVLIIITLSATQGRNKELYYALKGQINKE